MVSNAPRSPLTAVERPVPEPAQGQLRVEVRACAVCRTDLHIIDGELPDVRYPIVPGHEIVGVVDACGPGTSTPVGSRVGIPWLGRTCGRCQHCTHGRENLCDEALFTGCHVDGGYAEYAVADERFCFALPAGLDDVHAAPLLCAGLIGYRSLVAAGDARKLGLYGFGAAAHIVAQVALHQGREVHAFVRPGDERARQFARRLGCAWAGDATTMPAVPLDAAIIFAPVGELVPLALAAVRKGGTVVCGGIHMSDIPSFPYAALWGERVLRSVANLTRRDGHEFLPMAAKIALRAEVTTWPLAAANEALDALRGGGLTGAAVLIPPRAA